MKNVLEYLEATARRMPEKTAVVEENASCTWRELEEGSRRVGSALLHKTRPGEPVAVLMEKSILTLTAFLGTVYAGGFYVPLDPSLPGSRLRQILSVLHPRCIVADAAHLSLAKKLAGSELVLMAEKLVRTGENLAGLEAVQTVAIDTDPLYCNFTSGSTGVPKGVLVCHRSVIDFIDCFTGLFGISEDDVLDNQAPFDFDVSVKDIYSALKTGATLVLIPRGLFSRPAELLDYLCLHRVTNLTWAVSALCLVSTFHGLDYKTPDTVRRVLFSGEVMPLKHLKAWMEHLPETTFVNLYGPTEITCNCTYHIIDRARDYSGGIPMGEPFPNERVFLLDAEDKLVTEPDVEGEVCVAGSALALGYFNAPEQTAKHFVSNPLNSAWPQPIYRTGDLARWSEAGELFFAGRKDFQIKYQGHRIELEEIERSLSAVEGVERACCIFDEKKSRLYGFYVGSPDSAALHTELSRTLPPFMIPGFLRQLEAMPLTKNGKIDRKALSLTTTRRRREHS